VSDLERVPEASGKIGRTGLHVTRLVFGGAPIGGLFAPVAEDDALATLEAAWAAGIRAFDTAPHYGVGLSERRLGRFLAGRPRAEYVLCTKVGRLLVPADDEVDGAEGFYGTPRLTRVRDYSRDGVLASLEGSLRRLGTDRVDIALIHDPDEHGPQALGEAYPALAELRDQGVIGAVGVGMNQVEMLEWFLPRADLDCVLVAGRYTLLDTRAAASLLPECARRGVAVLAGGVFNSGVLAAAPGPDATYDYQPAPPALIDRARRIGAACARRGVPLGAAALRFTLRHPAVTAAVVGARSPGEIRDDAGYLSGSPPGGADAPLPAPASDAPLPAPASDAPPPAPASDAPPPAPASDAPPPAPASDAPLPAPASDAPLPAPASDAVFDELFEELIRDGLISDPFGGTR
jgi:D-threo-aldose 1-dehydrogenase